MADLLKLDLGSGYNKPEGFIGIDKFKTEGTDIQWDLDKTPWEPIRDKGVSEVRAHHILEHLSDLPAVMKEIYRICVDGAQITIAVPSPNHDDFLDDPTHKTPITPNMMALFSKKNCAYFKEVGAANTPLADYLDVDFEVVSANSNLDPRYAQYLDSGEFILEKLMRENRNVVKEYQIVLKVIKEEE